MEYKYDTEKIFKKSKKGTCLVCKKKYTSKYDIGACQSCFKSLVITKTNAKKIYGMTDEDLEFIPKHQRSSAYHDCITYFCLKDIKIRAIEKKYGIYNPAKETYKSCVKEILEENEEHENNKLTRYDKRRDKLEKALAQHGLVIRSDSYYCNQYLHYGKFKLEDVVSMMITMDFFVTKTKYNHILAGLIENNEGISENDKEWAKKEALKKYLKNHDKNDVPQVVLNNYYKTETKKKKLVEV